MKKTLTKVLASLLAVLMLVGALPFASVAAAVIGASENDVGFTVEDLDRAVAESEKNRVQNATLADAEFSSVEAPEGYKPKAAQDKPLAAVGADETQESLPKVLLIEDSLPWDSYANHTVLDKITDYDVTTTNDFLNVNLEEYGVVVFANDQAFSTYQNYEEFKEYLELFASLGGVIVFGACDAGWADGTLNEKLPGDVSKKTHYVYDNYVVDSAHPIVTGALTENDVLLDEDLTCKYCSHVSFDENSLPAGSKIILREVDSDRPTLVEYPLGDGRVIASGLTWEYAYIYADSYSYVGDYSVKAMEDMFRYAIRVSNIDVDELNVLEQWRIEKKSHVVIVADAEAGMKNLVPVSGAKVIINGVEYTTNEEGTIITQDYGFKTVSVTADGYRDYKELYELTEQSSRIVFMEKDKNDGLPYVSMSSAGKNNKSPFIDLRNQTLHFTENDGVMLALHLDGNWNGHGKGKFNIIQEATNGASGKMIEVAAGEVLEFSPANVFSPDSQLKLQMVAADGTKSEMIDINIEIAKAHKKSEGPTENALVDEGVSKFDWLGDFPIESDNDIFKKLLTDDFSIAGDKLPIEISKSHNDDGSITYKMVIGMASGEGTYNILHEKTNAKDFKEMDSAWDDFKKEIKKFNKADDPGKYLDGIKKKYQKNWHRTKLRSLHDVEIDICGFGEVVAKDGKIVSSTGGVIVKGGYSVVLGRTFFAGPVPLYFELRAGFEAEASIGLNFYNEENGLTFNLVFDGLELALPKISLEGGVGVRNVATAGLSGSGDLKFKFPGPSNPDFNIDLNLDGSVHIKVLFIADYKWSFASTKIHLHPTEAALAMVGHSWNERADKLSPASREYLDYESDWYGAPVQLMDDDAKQSASVLQEGVMPEAMPRIHQFGDKQIMFFLRDVSYREIGNNTQLVYSVFEDGYWSTPEAVWESDTADFFFDSFVVDDKPVVVWQKSATVSEAAEPDEIIDAVAGNSELGYAIWDEETSAFVEQKYLTEDTALDMMPKLVVENDGVEVIWVTNDANNVFGTEGNYIVKKADVVNGNLKNVVDLYTTDEYITEIAAGNGDDAGKILFAAMDIEGKTNLYIIEDSEAKELVADQNCAGLTYASDMFMWQCDGMIYSYNTTDKAVEALKFDGECNISSAYSYITNGETEALVWSVSAEENFTIFASVKCGDIWTSPVEVVSGSEGAISFMDALMQADGNYVFAFNTVTYYNDEPDYTTLQYANIVPQTNVVVEYAEAEKIDYETETQNLNVVVKNTGLSTVDEVSLFVEYDDEVILDETVDVELMPGQSKTITKVLDVSLINKEVEAMIYAGVADDVDESDNTATVKLGLVDAQLALDVYEDEDQFLFVLTASNRSKTATNAALSIIEDSVDGVVLNMKNIGVVTNEENVQYIFAIDREKVDFNDQDFKVYFFVLSTLEEDWNDIDNVCQYTIEAPVENEVDPDGEIEVIEIVKPERIVITEGDLYFASTADESVQLHAEVYPENASVNSVTWSAENNDIIHITSEGLVTPLRQGVTKVTAKVADEISDTITVYVIDVPENERFTITFDANGGNTDVTTVETQDDGTVKMLPVPVREGYEFLGWYTAKTDGELVTEDTVFDADTTIFAHWKEIVVTETTEPTTTTEATETTVTEPATTVPSEPEFETGDVNCDGKLNIKDVTAIQKFLAKLIDFTDEVKMLADYNGDGLINIKDATTIQKKLANLI